MVNGEWQKRRRIRWLLIIKNGVACQKSGSEYVFLFFFSPKYAANLVSRASSSVTPSPPFRTGKKCRILKRKKYPFFLFSLFILAQPVEVTYYYFNFSFLSLSFIRNRRPHSPFPLFSTSVWWFQSQVASHRPPSLPPPLLLLGPVKTPSIAQQGKKRLNKNILWVSARGGDI